MRPLSGGGERARGAVPDLLDLVREVAGMVDSESLLPAISRVVRRLLDFTALRVFVTTEGEAGLRLAYDDAGDLEALVPSAVLALANRARAEGHTVVQSGAMAIPLADDQALAGVLQVEGSTSELSGERAAALQRIAGHLGVALRNVALVRDLRVSANLLGTLYEAGRETATLLDIDVLLTRVAEIVKRVIDYEMFGILLLEQSTGELVLRKAIRFGSLGEKPRIRVSEGLTGAAVRGKCPVLVHDVERDSRYLRLIPGVRSELVVPLIHQDRVLGVFDLESSQLGRFTEEHVQILTPLANQVAGAFENARLYGELRRSELRLQRELSIAREVQAGLLPEDPPEGAAYETSAHFRPALELGGDLYDFYPLGEDQLGLAVGDVAGKGVPAALFGAFVSGTLRGRAFEKRGPAELVARANRTLRNRSVEGLYCALTYAFFDFAAGEVRLTASGLPYPLRYRAQSGRCERIEASGLPLGVFDEATWDEVRLPLESGDVFVFFTDGVSEADGGQGEFGSARVAAIVESTASSEAARIGAAIVQAVEVYLGDRQPADDVTVVVVKVRPQRRD